MTLPRDPNHFSQLTAGQKAVLLKVADGELHRRPKTGTSPWVACKNMGLIRGQWVDAQTGAKLTHQQVVDRKFEGCETRDYITDEGRALLSQTSVCSEKGTADE